MNNMVAEIWFIINPLEEGGCDSKAAMTEL